MATARPGWSRRAQYGLFFSFLAVMAGIIVGAILLTLSLVAPQQFARVRGAALDVTAPVTDSLSEVTATVEGLFTGAGNYWDAASQNAKLKREHLRPSKSVWPLIPSLPLHTWLLLRETAGIEESSESWRPASSNAPPSPLSSSVWKTASRTDQAAPWISFTCCPPLRLAPTSSHGSADTPLP